MVLATLLLVFAAPQTDEVAKAPAVLFAKAFNHTSSDSIVTLALPSAPEPKVNSEARPASLRSEAEPLAPVRAAQPTGESPRQRKVWYGLVAAGHAAAGFDAWSTRRAISGGYGQEANPFLKPFANSNAIYAATQVSPAFVEFFGKRMMVSQNPWMRKFWWLPQAAGVSASLVAGRHNLGIAH